MHHLMVGVRIVDGRPEFFGWDEVNEYIRHGMRVVRVEPAEVFELESETKSVGGAVFTVIMDDFGIDAP